MELAECIETLSPQVSYLAARGLPMRFVDAHGSTAPFLQAVSRCGAACRRGADACAGDRPVPHVRAQRRSAPAAAADDRPASVTHAYAAMKLLTQRAGLVVHDLLLGAAPSSPRAERIAMQIATCADDFLGAVLRDWVQIDPACDAHEAPDAGAAPLGARDACSRPTAPLPAATRPHAARRHCPHAMN